MDLETMTGYADQSKDQPARFHDAATDSMWLMSKLPELRTGIEEAFRANRYGDAHREVVRYQEEFRIAQFGKRGAVDPQRIVNLLGVNPQSGPYYYFSETDLTSSSPTPEVHERFSHRLGALEGRGEPSGPIAEMFADPATGYRYNAEYTLLALLKDFDADFLLLGLSASAWTALQTRAASWEEAVNQMIVDSYFPEGKLDEPRLRAAIPVFNASENLEPVGLFAEALPKFCEGQRRCFLRGAVENAQRLVLAGHQPTGILVKSQLSILRSWHAFLGRRVRGVFADQSARSRNEQHWRDEVRNLTTRGARRAHRVQSEESSLPDWDDEDEIDEL